MADEVHQLQLSVAAMAAATLGAQGAPAWSRTAELLLLSFRDVRLSYCKAVREIDALGVPVPEERR
ncbi:MAG: hypothetical protein R2736_13820 [Solirubrobacterales bacterium]